MPTINDHGDIVVDASHPIIDTGHSIVDIMRGLQNLSSGHPSLLICQIVQLLQRILDLIPSK
jgi:hypothetical protein